MITLYYAPRTRAARVRWLLEELELPSHVEGPALHVMDPALPKVPGSPHSSGTR
jgi:hypothetical protein